MVQANDIDDFGHELRIGGELEPVDQVRFEIKPAPDPPDRRGRQPDFFAIDVRDQCVAFFGVSSSVAMITSSTLSNRIDGGRPGRGSSSNPSKRLSTKRPRHLATVCSITRKSAATCLFVAPGSAQAKMIRARNANACADFARRDHRCSWSRSAPDSTRSAFGRPGRRLSIKPSTPSASNRLRHLSTVATVTPRSAATRAGTAAGSANANTILARTARRDDSPRDSATSRSRCRSVSSNFPAPDTAESIRPSYELTIADLRRDTLAGRQHQGRLVVGMEAEQEPGAGHQRCSLGLAPVLPCF